GPPPPRRTLFPYTTLFRSKHWLWHRRSVPGRRRREVEDRESGTRSRLQALEIRCDPKNARDRAYQSRLRNTRAAMTNGTTPSTTDRKSTRLNSSHDQISYA